MVRLRLPQGRSRKPSIYLDGNQRSLFVTLGPALHLTSKNDQPMWQYQVFLLKLTFDSDGETIMAKTKQAMQPLYPTVTSASRFEDQSNPTGDRNPVNNFENGTYGLGDIDP
jgi:hypothetical protein